MMFHGTYIGIRNRLKGKTALIQEVKTGWHAQFDDRTQKEAWGWHWFPKTAFKVNGRDEP